MSKQELKQEDQLENTAVIKVKDELDGGCEGGERFLVFRNMLNNKNLQIG